jgi:hypothetical protein
MRRKTRRSEFVVETDGHLIIDGWIYYPGGGLHD